VLTLKNLLRTAEKLYDMYSMSAAYESANHGLADEADGIFTMFPIGEPWHPQMAGGVSTARALHDQDGDRALANSILLMCDGLWLVEACQTVATGDIGHMWEILKVRKDMYGC